VPDRGDVSSRLNKARRLAGTLASDPAARYAQYVSWFGADDRLDLYTPGFAAQVGDADATSEITTRWAQASGTSVVDRMLEVDVSTYLVDDLIAKIDIATMAHALEARSPFLDHRVMELGASIPANLKVRGGEKKWILREALRPWLPGEILDRGKQGFSVPLSSWLRTDLRGWAQDILLDPATRARGYFKSEAVTTLLDRHLAGADGDGRRIYALLMFELWHREFVDSPTIELRSAA
jgi:asparagine synthase (glutamine-hydrolysing)